MREDHIKNQLGSLRGLAPDESFAQNSKQKIIYGAHPKPGGFHLFSQSLSTSLSMALVVVFFAFVAVSSVSNILTSPVSPTLEGVSQPSLIAEADDINASTDIHLKDAEYLASDSKRLLAKIKVDEAEVEIPEDDEDITDEEIDQLLNKAKNY